MDAFVTVVRFEATQLCFSLVAKHLFELGRLAHVDRVLCRGERDRRRGAQAFGELHRRAFQLFRRHHLIHDAQSRRFGRIDRVTEKKHLARFVWRDETRQKISAAPVRMKSDFRKRLAERCSVRRDTQVTCKREIASRARSWTIDRQRSPA